MDAVDKENKVAQNARTSMPVRLKYDMTSAVYANQFIINNGPQEVFIDFSSGAIPDTKTGQTVVPIHTRMAMTLDNAKRLGELLLKAAAKEQR